MVRSSPIRPALAALLLALSLVPAAARAEDPVAQARALSGPFTAVRLEGPYELTLREGNPAAAVVTARAAVQPKVKV